MYIHIHKQMTTKLFPRNHSTVSVVFIALKVQWMTCLPSKDQSCRTEQFQRWWIDSGRPTYWLRFIIVNPRIRLFWPWQQTRTVLMDQKEFSPPKFGERELIGVVFRRATFKVVWLLEQNILIRINRRIQLNLVQPLKNWCHWFLVR